MIEIRTVAATRYVAPLREGGSLPGLMEADDFGWIRDWWEGARGRRGLFDTQHLPTVPDD